MRRLLIVGGLLLLVGAAIFLFRARGPWEPAGPVATGCDLGLQPCRVDLGDGHAVELVALTRPVPLLVPVEFAATFTGGPAQRVSLSITGEKMPMGVTRVAFGPREDGGFGGSGRLPVCTVDAMTWIARLDFDLDGVPLSRSFTFETRRAPPTPP